MNFAPDPPHSSFLLFFVSDLVRPTGGGGREFRVDFPPVGGRMRVCGVVGQMYMLRMYTYMYNIDICIYVICI